MSRTTFQLPSGCFFQTVTYLPLSFTVLPEGSLKLNSYVPLENPRSPDFAASTRVGVQVSFSPVIWNIPPSDFLIASWPSVAGAFGSYMAPPGATNDAA